MSKPIILFIVEGEKRDISFIDSLSKKFLGQQGESRIIQLPAAQNIYMLYQKLVQDDFQTDILEVLKESNSYIEHMLKDVSRDDIAEIYLFFDMDPHHTTLSGVGFKDSNVVERMLRAFDNETDQGKLYISYPMVESVYDFANRQPLCKAYSSCFFPFDHLKEYKYLAGKDNPFASKHGKGFPWETVLKVFVHRVRCLFECSALTFSTYREEVTTLSIYQKESLLLKKKNCIFILNAFPEFIFDYFGKGFWDDNAALDGYDYTECSPEERNSLTSTL